MPRGSRNGFLDLLAGKIPTFDLQIWTHHGHGLSNTPIPAAKIYETSLKLWTDGPKNVVGIVNASGLAFQTSQAVLARGIKPSP